LIKKNGVLSGKQNKYLEALSLLFDTKKAPLLLFESQYGNARKF